VRSRLFLSLEVDLRPAVHQGRRGLSLIRVYGIPPVQVVGSSVKLKLEMRDGKLAMVKLPAADLVDHKEGKPLGIFPK
jgi:hypothetical protein